MDGKFLKVGDGRLGSLGFVQLGSEIVFGMLFGLDDEFGEVEPHVVDIRSEMFPYYSLRPSSVFYEIAGARYETSASDTNLVFSNSLTVGSIAFSEGNTFLVIRHDQTKFYIYLNLETGLVCLSTPRIIGLIVEWRVVTPSVACERLLMSKKITTA